MLAYEKMRHHQKKPSSQIKRMDSEREYLGLNSNSRINLQEQPSPTKPMQPVQQTAALKQENTLRKPEEQKNLLKSNSVRFIHRDIQLPNAEPQPALLTTIPRKSVAFEDYNGIEENPLGKRDGLEHRDEDMNLRQNIRYLLGQERVQTNKGKWRIVEIGEAIEENTITYSRLLLAFWVCLPQSLFKLQKIYWFLATIVSFFVKTQKSSTWFVVILVLVIVLEIGLKMFQVIGKFTNAKESDMRKCQRLNIGTQTFQEIRYDELRSGDIIRVDVQTQFPCDCVLLYSPQSRLINVNQEHIRGRYAPLILKEAILSQPKNYEGMLYIRADTDISSMQHWIGKAHIDGEVYTLSNKNLCLRGSINHDSPDTICAVMYTSKVCLYCSMQPEGS